MAFRKKANKILSFNPDVLIVQECEHIDKIIFEASLPQPTSAVWYGDSVHKGLGVFSFNGFRLRKCRNHNAALKTIAPIEIISNTYNVMLFAIWANNASDPDGQYVTQVWKAIHHYSRQIKGKQTILAGDFNSNAIWDRKSRIGNHSDVVAKLANKGIKSCYHHHHNQAHGREAHPTFFLYKHEDKPYHLDYCFASSDLTDSILNVEIGQHKDWYPYSDHVPIIIDFDTNKRN